MSDTVADVLRRLTVTFTEFEGRLEQTPLVRKLTRGRFDSLAKIGELRSPLLFFHGDRDEVVPWALGRALYEAAPEPKRFTTIRGAGHNDTVAVGGAAYFERIGAFLDEVAPPP